MRFLLAWVSLVSLAVPVAGANPNPGRQALLLDPGGAIRYRDPAISVEDLAQSSDGLTFALAGRAYPATGKALWDAVEANRRTFDVLGRVKVRGGTLLYEGNVIDVGIPVEAVHEALAWGDLVACLGWVVHSPRSWDEPDKAHAVFVFSPTVRRGGHRVLTLVGKVRFRLLLVDPIEPRAPASSSPR